MRPWPIGSSCAVASKADVVAEGLQKATASKKTMTDAMDVNDLLVAYFLRAVQIKFVIHRCTLNYCKKNGPCRFFFPYEQPQDLQAQNEVIDRIAHIRRHIVDDAYVTAHNLDLLVLAGSHVQMQIFCPIKGGRMAGVYCVLYTGKSEKTELLETLHPGDNAVATYLKTRVLGAPMVIYRQMGGSVLRLNNDVDYTTMGFSSTSGRQRSLAHTLKSSTYVKEKMFLTSEEKFLWRPARLHHLRVDQWQRYYKCVPKGKQPELSQHDGNQTRRGFTREWRAVHDEPDDPANPHYDKYASEEPIGQAHEYEYTGCDLRCVRRENKHFGFLRTWNYSLSSERCADGRSNRDHFFEVVLFRSLPWYAAPGADIFCDVPCPGNTGSSTNSWQITKVSFSKLVEKCAVHKSKAGKFEAICMHLERQFNESFSCKCCSGERRGFGKQGCRVCETSFIPIGWHACEYASHKVWKTGTLWQCDDAVCENFLLDLREQGVPLKVLRDEGEKLIGENRMSLERLKIFIEIMSHDMGVRVDSDPFSSSFNVNYVSNDNQSSDVAPTAEARLKK